MGSAGAVRCCDAFLLSTDPGPRNTRAAPCKTPGAERKEGHRECLACLHCERKKNPPTYPSLPLQEANPRKFRPHLLSKLEHTNPMHMNKSLRYFGREKKPEPTQNTKTLHTPLSSPISTNIRIMTSLTHSPSNLFCANLFYAWMGFEKAAIAASLNASERVGWA